uniref:Fork-head domain-containing protein n=1 Tax=Globodera rostochiensis TaxID=31243 RepID=A0A914HZ44_GLORO
MSYFPPTIRYEYAEESNTSQPSMYAADPPLFKEDVPDEAQYFLHSNGSSNPSLPFPSSTMVHDDENLPPSAVAFSSFGIADISHEFHHIQPTPSSSSVDYYYWQSDEASSSSVGGDEKRRPTYVQYDDRIQMRQCDGDGSAQILNFPTVHAHQRHQFVHGETVSLPPERSDPGTMPSLAEQLTMRRVPLQSMENSSVRSNPKDSEDFSPTICFSIGKTEAVESIPQKRSGPPAHWRVEESEKKQKRTVKKAPFHKSTTSEMDEGGRQLIVVRGADSFRLNDDDDEERTADIGERAGPSVARNGFVKPAYSYSCLIGLSMKNSDTGELTVSEIYAFLCHHFPYFREAPSGWKNSVRHNLSLNKCFQKIEVETPGSHGRKSCLWRMNPQKCAKMDQELGKWRDRDEKRILDAMEMPQNLDALQNGTIGMPPNMKPRRFSIPLTVIECNHQSVDVRSSSGNVQQQQNFVSTPLPLRTGRSSSIFLLFLSRNAHDQNNCASLTDSDRQRHSAHAQAARKLENLLQQKQISSDPVADETTNYFGGFTLIGGPSGSGGKKRRPSRTFAMD